LGIIWSDLLQEPLFRVGIVIKVLLIIFLLPTIQQEWFVPFIVNWIENPVILPWTGHIAAGNDPLAFPYGPIMFLSHLPTTVVGWFVDYLFGFTFFAAIGFKVSLLGADILLLLLLLQTFDNSWKGLLVFYWLSPLILFITYWHGQTDIIPVVLFVYALALVKRKYFALAGVLLACSIGAKHSMLIGVPFVLIYLWAHRGIRREMQQFLFFLLGGVLLIEAPLFFSDAFRVMVLENREIDKLYWLVINIGNNTLIYLTPIAYLLLLYFFWRIKRVNFDLLVTAMGVAFSIVILMTPSPPGWYLWLLPMLAIHQSRYGSGAVILTSLFSVLFITYHLIHTSGVSSTLFDYGSINLDILRTARTQSIHYTLIVGFGLLIAIQILREGVRGNDYYRLGSRPISLGIAGDSGVGKSSLARGLALVFGERSTVEVSGDDYHNWDRLSPMWKTLTHLDPKANRLFDMVNDVRALMIGSAVRARSYDHQTGHFLPAKINKSRGIVLVEGLHALYSQQMLEELDVRIFVEMDEALRVYLRVQRDTKERGHSKEKVLREIDRRKSDGEYYIKPQAENADLIFKILPVNLESLKEDGAIIKNLMVRVSVRNGIYYHDLVRVLVGVCGLQVNIESIDERGLVILEVSGDIASEDVKLAVTMLVPHMDEMLNIGTEFADGVQGVMQIITLMEIDQALKRRRVV